MKDKDSKKGQAGGAEKEEGGVRGEAEKEPP